MKIVISLGARPSIIKMARVISEARHRRNLESILVHTGQHYDWEMSASFFNELRLPDPDYDLNVRSGSHGRQTAKVIVGFENVLAKEKPDFVVVDGDTNSALGCAIASSKMKIPVGHVEAGCRSFDKTMPEEINRIIISHIASLHFAPTRNCVNNLRAEGIERKAIFLTGHPLVDLMLQLSDRIKRSKMMQEHSLHARGFYVVTLHRDFNTDNRDRLKAILQSVDKIAMSRPIIFPIHPRTGKNIFKFKLSSLLSRIIVSKPIGYLEMLGIMKNARAILTDSGGIQQEAAILGTPCITLRENTEWTETLMPMTNTLVGASARKIAAEVIKIEQAYSAGSDPKKTQRNIFGHQGASAMIIDTLSNQIVKNSK